MKEEKILFVNWPNICCCYVRNGAVHDLFILSHLVSHMSKVKSESDAGVASQQLACFGIGSICQFSVVTFFTTLFTFHCNRFS